MPDDRCQMQDARRPDHEPLVLPANLLPPTPSMRCSRQTPTRRTSAEDTVFYTASRGISLPHACRLTRHGGTTIGDEEFTQHRQRRPREIRALRHRYGARLEADSEQFSH